MSAIVEGIRKVTMSDSSFVHTSRKHPEQEHYRQLEEAYEHYDFGKSPDAGNRRVISGESEYSDNSVGHSCPTLYNNRDKDKTATNHVNHTFLEMVAIVLPPNRPDISREPEFETVQLRLVALRLEVNLNSENDGTLVAKNRWLNGFWGHTDPVLLHCAIEVCQNIGLSTAD